MVGIMSCKKEMPSGPTTIFTIGKIYGGGFIFYIDSTGQHGLVVATIDQNTGAKWGSKNSYLGTTSYLFGSGKANTTAIVTGCPETGIAARIADDLVLNGYSDWFLPSSEELELMARYKYQIGGFKSTFYWSSTEVSESQAAACYFSAGIQDKDSLYPVRCIRSF